MKKEYITWVRFMAHPSRINIDPKTNVENNWGHLIKLTTLSYGNIPNVDRRLLGIIEYDEEILTEELLNQFCLENSCFGFTRITSEKALELCNKWYGDKSFELDKDKFSLINNIILEELPIIEEK